MKINMFFAATFFAGVFFGIQFPLYLLLRITITSLICVPFFIYLIKKVNGPVKALPSIFITVSIIVNVTMWVTYFIAQHITT